MLDNCGTGNGTRIFNATLTILRLAKCKDQHLVFLIRISFLFISELHKRLITEKIRKTKWITAPVQCNHFRFSSVYSGLLELLQTVIGYQIILCLRLKIQKFLFFFFLAVKINGQYIAALRCEQGKVMVDKIQPVTWWHWAEDLKTKISETYVLRKPLFETFF